MKSKQVRRMVFRLFLMAIVMAMVSGSALAFCPMCRTAIEGATGAQEFSDSLNLAAIVLLAPPAVIFIGLFGWFYRLRNVTAPAPASTDAANSSRSVEL